MIHSSFAQRLLAWFDQHGRHDLPWQTPRTAYRVWIAEVMLQQTQVQTVIPYYQRFLEQFPSLPALAAAPLDAVLAMWSGLGYYSRARNLHRAASLCMSQHGGEVPKDFAAIAALPGIGRSTAGAILAQAHGARFPILDGNVRRVLARFCAVGGDPGAAATQQTLWQLSAAALPQQRLADYTQALMDLGATLCTRARPQCARCPLQTDCLALARDQVSEFPQPRARRIRPLRQTCMLWVEDEQQRLLLVRRPGVGIWAGLWSLVDGEDLPSALAQLTALGVLPGQNQSMTQIRHEFTHYSLDIQVQRLRASGGVSDSEWRWLYPDEALQLGLPQPVRRLIAENATSCANP